MSDLDDRIRETLNDPRRQLPAWPDPMPRIRRAAHRQRARLAAGAGAAAAVLAIGIVVPVVALSPAAGTQPGAGSSPAASPGSRSAAPPVARGWIQHAESAAGVSIATPASWNFNRDPFNALAGPTTLFAAGTGPVPSGGSCAPTAALSALPPKGALLAVMEYSVVDEPYVFPPRPEHLALGPLGGPAECWGVKDHTVLFEDGGRYFQANAVFGTGASAALRAQVRRSLNTFRAQPVPVSQQPAAQCQAGHWTACPQAAWVYEVMNQAKVFHLGHRGSYAILALAGQRSFTLRTTKSRPPGPGRCQQMAGVRVCRAGVQLGWTVDGLWLSADPASSPYAGKHARAGLPDSSVLTRLIRASKSTRLIAP
jgi:hypothetical protein